MGKLQIEKYELCIYKEDSNEIVYMVDDCSSEVIAQGSVDEILWELCPKKICAY